MVTKKIFCPNCMSDEYMECYLGEIKFFKCENCNHEFTDIPDNIGFGNQWNDRFMELARHVSLWSKDPSTQVGAVIVDDKKRVVGMGYNGFPRGVDDSYNRYDEKKLKYNLVVHAEANAILNAVKSVEGMTLYSTLFTCAECAKLIIQAGIKKIVAPEIDFRSSWSDSFNIACLMYKEAGIEVIKL